MPASTNRTIQILEQSQVQLLAEWVKQLRGALTSRTASQLSDTELQVQCQEFITLFRQAVARGNLTDISTDEWRAVRDFLAGVSRSRSRQGFSPSETAQFVFSFKLPLFDHLRAAYGSEHDAAFRDTWELSMLLDKLGLYTTELYQTAREELIGKQREEMLELSTPVIQLWEGILALPIIGTLDSARTQVVMEALLQKIVSSRAPVAILDITGVPTVDTLTAQHLLKTIAAARLMGAECIISGIRPQIAQTIVHLGVDLGDIITKASLADAFRLALKRTGQTLSSSEPRS